MITYTIEPWPAETRAPGGQHVGTGPSGIRAVALSDGVPMGLEACCSLHRSQWANRRAAIEAIEWMLTK